MRILYRLLRGLLLLGALGVGSCPAPSHAHPAPTPPVGTLLGTRPSTRMAA